MDSRRSKLTILCAAPGAGSSLYLRLTSGACDCDIVIITDTSVVSRNRLARPARFGRGCRSGCSSVAQQPAQFHLWRRTGTRGSGVGSTVLEQWQWQWRRMRVVCYGIGRARGDEESERLD